MKIAAPADAGLGNREDAARAMFRPRNPVVPAYWGETHSTILERTER